MISVRAYVRRLVDNSIIREEWVEEQLSLIPTGAKLLDAGCGEQRYRRLCSHLNYYAQDFGEYKVDHKSGLAASSNKWQYGELDYVGDIWDIKEQNDFFDVVLCTEVLEHVPRPQDALKELIRVLRPGGTLIITVPANSLRHQDPYYFFSGFSDRFFE